MTHERFGIIIKTSLGIYRLEALAMYISRALLALLTTALVAAGIAAQATRTMTSVQRRLDTLDRHVREYDREAMGKDGKPLSQAEIAKRTRQRRLEIEEDLKGMQAVYNQIVVRLQGAEIQAGFAAETATVVRKQASRLKDNLILPDPEATSEKQGDPEVLNTERAALRALARSLYDFISNPIFDDTAVMDAKHAVKARLDLERVIVLSGQITAQK